MKIFMFRWNINQSDYRLKWFGIRLPLLIAGLLSGLTGWAADPAIMVSDQFVEGELLIRFKSGVTPASRNDVARSVGAVSRGEFGASGVSHWRLGKGLSVDAALKVLASPGHARFIEYAEPNYLWHASTLPNDSRFTDLYGLNNVGHTGGAVDADIDAPEAWAAEVSPSLVLVGVIDSGIDYNHPDLQGRIWNNTAETANGLNGLDDDGNGYIDDVRGWDFANNDNDPMDDNDHGTHVAGTIAAVRDNGIGVAGVAQAVRLVPLKFLSASGSGSSDNAIRAIVYADRIGARLTNNSWGGGSRSRALQDAIAASQALFVAAAGNAASSTKQYPAGYDDAKILSVAATDHADVLATFSNYGTWVDLAAPGVTIVSTLRNNRYGGLSGTSMASPHVAGAAAMLFAQDPFDNISTVKNQLLSTVDSIPGLAGKVLTGGRLNLVRAMGTEPPSTDGDMTPPGALTNLATQDVTDGSVTLNWTASGDDADVGTATAYEIRYLANDVLDALNWSSGTAVTGEPVPAKPATVQSMAMGGLQSQTGYSFGIRAFDETGNLSPVAATNASTLAGDWQVGTVVTNLDSSVYFDVGFINGLPVAGYSGAGARFAFADSNGNWQDQLVESGAGWRLSFAVSSLGIAAMAYSSNGPGTWLRYAERASSGSWSLSTIESRDADGYTSIAFDQNRNPAIAYRLSGKVKALKLARRINGVWQKEIVQNNAGAARYVSLAFDGANQPVIAWSDDLNADNTLETLRLSRRSSSGWQTDTVETGVAGYGVHVDVSVHPVTGLLAIVHDSGNVRYLEQTAGGWTATDLELSAASDGSTLTHDAAGNPHVALRRADGLTHITRDAGGPLYSRIKAGSSSFGRPKVQLDPEGLPAVIYKTPGEYRLELARKNP